MTHGWSTSRSTGYILLMHMLYGELYRTVVSRSAHGLVRGLWEWGAIGVGGGREVGKGRANGSVRVRGGQ